MAYAYMHLAHVFPLSSSLVYRSFVYITQALSSHISNSELLSALYRINSTVRCTICLLAIGLGDVGSFTDFVDVKDRKEGSALLTTGMIGNCSAVPLLGSKRFFRKTLRVWPCYARPTMPTINSPLRFPLIPLRMLTSSKSLTRLPGRTFWARVP
jgi:hypothetical protein